MATRRPSESTTLQIGVGLFVSVALAGFLWLLIGLRLGPDRYPLIAEFDTIVGVNEATKVKLRGFTVGQVEGIEFRPMPPAGEPHFRITLGIESNYPVPSGVIAEIRGSGLVGESHIHLDAVDAHGGPLAPGSRIEGRSDESMKTLIKKLREAAGKLSGAGGAITDADLGTRLLDLTAAVDRVADDLGNVSRSADSLLLAGRHTVVGLEPGIERSLAGLEQTMSRLATTMARTDTLVVETSRDVQQTVRSLRLVAERLDAVLSRVDSMALGRQVQLEETVDNLHATSSAVRELSENPWKLIIGRGDGEVAEEMGDAP